MGHQIRDHAPALIIGAALADLAAVVVFVTVGRNSHDDPLSVSGLIGTGWPFVVGIVGGYLGIVRTGWPLLGPRGGAVIVVSTVLIGVALRAGVAGDGAPVSFVVVTVLVLSALMLGWRAVAGKVLRRAAQRSA